MKTRILTPLFSLMLLASVAVALFAQPGVVVAGKNTASGITFHQSAFKTKAATAVSNSIHHFVCSSASYFRTFMPYNTDPCNHTPSQKTLC